METVTVTLRAPMSARAAIGIFLEDEMVSGVGYVVTGVSGLAEASTQNSPGFVALGFARGEGSYAPPESTICFCGRLAAGESIMVTLRLPPCRSLTTALPRRGTQKT